MKYNVQGYCSVDSFHTPKNNVTRGHSEVYVNLFKELVLHRKHTVSVNKSYSLNAVHENDHCLF
jgi:hypothetical protein